MPEVDGCETVLDDTETVELVTDETLELDATELDVTEHDVRVEELVVSVCVVVDSVTDECVMVEADCELAENINDVEDTVLDVLSVELVTELMVESVALETVDVVELDSVVVGEPVLLLTAMVELDEMVGLGIGEHVVELDMVVELVTVDAVCGLVLTEKAVEVFVLDT